MTEIGRVQLRNEYLVLETADGWEVQSADGRGRTFSQRIDESVVARAEECLSGDEWSVDEATARLQDVAENEGWPFTYGFKLRFFVQGIIVTLVARGRADYEKVGRGFRYRIG